MERHYYLLKIGLIALAIAVAVVTGGIGSTQMSHAVAHARYSAPAEIEAAAWRTTAWIAHGLSRLMDSALTQSLSD